jgi:hypothetical protein
MLVIFNEQSIKVKYKDWQGNRGILMGNAEGEADANNERGQTNISHGTNRTVI